MTTRYDAMQGIVEASNIAMRETLSGCENDRYTREGKLRALWEPVARALLDSIPEDFERDYPDEAAKAADAGVDFVGVTSDTRRPVFWGPDQVEGGIVFREFVIG